MPPPLLTRLSRSPAWLNVGAFLLLAACVAWFLRAPGVWWIDGHPHDVPLNIVSGHLTRLHPDALPSLHTPFGWIHFALHAAAWPMVDWFPDRDVGRLVPLASLLFGLGLVAYYALVRRFCAPWLQLPWWGCAALLTLTLSLRHMAWVPEALLLSWYSPYNNQLWSLWFLQLLLVLGWQRRCRVAPGSITPKACLAYAGLQAMFLYVELNDKVNFFAGGVLLCLSGLVWLPGRAAWRVLLILAALGAGLTGLTALAGYDYAFWAADFLRTIEAKRSFIGESGVPYIFTSAAAWMLLRAYGETVGAIHPRYALRDGIVLLGMCVISVGNFPAIHLHFLCATALLLLLGHEGRYVCLGASVAKNSLCLHAANAMKLGLAYVVLCNLAGMAALGWWRTHPRAEGHEMADIAAVDGRHWRVWRMREKLPVGPQTPLLVTSRQMTRQYLSFLMEGQAMLARLPDIRTHRVGTTEMSNPFPWMMGADYPRDNLHWADPGVSFGLKDGPGMLARYYAGSDAVLLPIYIVPDKMHRRVNCSFLTWNRAHGSPFTLRERGEAASLYVRRDWHEAQRRDPAAEPFGSLDLCAEEKARIFSDWKDMP